MKRSTGRTGPGAAGRQRGTDVGVLQAAAMLAAAMLAAATPAAAAEPASPLVDAESRFAAAVAADGIRAGFLAFLADSAVSLEPTPRPARPIFEAATDDGSRLAWRPDMVTLSKGGDFGWTSGPYLSYGRDSATATEAGHFVTVWRKDPPTGWRVLLDAGVDYPLPPDRRDRHLSVTARLRPGGSAVGADAATCDGRFFEQWRRKGRRRALEDFAARDVRLLGPGMAPLDGPGAAGLDPLNGVPLAAARVARRLQSSGGDLLVVYGDYEYAATAERPRGHETFALAFDAGRDCRLALELRVRAAGGSAP